MDEQSLGILVKLGRLLATSTHPYIVAGDFQVSLGIAMTIDFTQAVGATLVAASDGLGSCRGSRGVVFLPLITCWLSNALLEPSVRPGFAWRLISTLTGRSRCLSSSCCIPEVILCFCSPIGCQQSCQSGLRRGSRAGAEPRRRQSSHSMLLSMLLHYKLRVVWTELTGSGHIPLRRSSCISLDAWTSRGAGGVPHRSCSFARW